MIALVAVLMALLVIATVALIAVVAYGMPASDHEERARVEAEARRAEYRLHRIASDAFTQMMDVARDHGFRADR